MIEVSPTEEGHNCRDCVLSDALSSKAWLLWGVAPSGAAPAVGQPSRLGKGGHVPQARGEADTPCVGSDDPHTHNVIHTRGSCGKLTGWTEKDTAKGVAPVTQRNGAHSRRDLYLPGLCEIPDSP